MSIKDSLLHPNVRWAHMACQYAALTNETHLHQQSSLVNCSVACFMFFFLLWRLEPRALCVCQASALWLRSPPAPRKFIWNRLSWLCSPAPYLEGVAAVFQVHLLSSCRYPHPALPQTVLAERWTNSHSSAASSKMILLLFLTMTCLLL